MSVAVLTETMTIILEHYIFACLHVLNVIFLGFLWIHVFRIRHRPMLS